MENARHESKVTEAPRANRSVNTEHSLYRLFDDPEAVSMNPLYIGMVVGRCSACKYKTGYCPTPTSSWPNDKRRTCVSFVANVSKTLLPSGALDPASSVSASFGKMPPSLLVDARFGPVRSHETFVDHVCQSWMFHVLIEFVQSHPCHFSTAFPGILHGWSSIDQLCFV